MMKRLSVLMLAMFMAMGMMSREKGNIRWYDYDRKNYCGVRLGMSAAQLFLSGGMDNVDISTRVGWDVGFVVGHQIGGAGVPLFVEGGLHFIQKPVSIKWNAGDEVGDVRMDVDRNCLQLPVIFKYKITTGVDDMTVQPFAGGWFSVGMVGDTRHYPQHQSTSTFSSTFLRRADAGLRVGCALAYQNLYLEAAYDIGLANVARTNCQYFGYDSFDNKVRTGCFTATIGLDF